MGITQYYLVLINYRNRCIKTSLQQPAWLCSQHSSGRGRWVSELKGCLVYTKGVPSQQELYSETLTQTDKQKQSLQGSITDLSVTPVSGDLMLFSGLCRHQACKRTGTDTSKISIHIKNFKETYK